MSAEPKHGRRNRIKGGNGMGNGQERREIKRRARASVRRHYLLFLFICLIAAAIGTQFRSELRFLQLNREQIETADRFLASFGREGFEADSRGVLAMAVRRITNGSLTSIIDETIRSLAGSSELLLSVGILLSGAVFVLLWVFVVDPFDVAMRRPFLEGRVYARVGLHRLTYPLQVRRWVRVSLAMLRMNIQQLLWSLTVVGGIIKNYAYAMTPFILAENPDLTGKEAILLSRRMMDGHKRALFVLDVTLLPWRVLSVLTLGLSDVFFASSYRVAAYAEFYACRREEALAAGLEGAGVLRDTYLYERADAETLAAAYPETARETDIPERRYRNGVERFFCETFGVTLWPEEQDMEIERAQMQALHGRYAAQCAAGEAYPLRLGPLPVVEKKQRRTLLYSRKYSVFSLVMIFFIFSMIGWAWEVGLHLLEYGTFVNRGVLHGPWLPIYGAGVVLTLLALYRARKKPVLEFVLTMVLCGAVEYMTAYVLETTHGGARWWDYGGYFLNLHGRICAEGLLVFGLGGMAAVYGAAPLLDNLLRRMKRGVLLGLCAVLLVCFAADQIYSSANPNAGAGITSIESAAQTQEAAVAEDAPQEAGVAL